MRQIYDNSSSHMLSLRRRRILIVEDEHSVAEEARHAFRGVGAEVIGPVSSLQEAFRIVEGMYLDGAVLGINLQGELIFPLAEKLREQGVPFVFLTGCERWSIPMSYQSIPVCRKPTETAEIARALFG